MEELQSVARRNKSALRADPDRQAELFRLAAGGAILLKDPGPVAHHPVACACRISGIAQRQSLRFQAAPRGLDEKAGNGEKAAGVVRAEVTPIMALNRASGCRIKTPRALIIVIMGQI